MINKVLLFLDVCFLYIVFDDVQHNSQLIHLISAL